MKLFTKKTISYLLIISMILTPFTTAHANEDISQNDMIVEQNNTPDVEVYDTVIKINGTFYTKDEFSILLKSSREIPIRQKRTALTIPAAAGAYFIPGVGQVLITTTGIVILAGATIATGTWVSNRIISSKNTLKTNERVHMINIQNLVQEDPMKRKKILKRVVNQKIKRNLSNLEKERNTNL